MPTLIIIPPTQQETDSHAARARRAQDRQESPNANSVPALRGNVTRLQDRVTALEDEVRQLRALLRSKGLI